MAIGRISELVKRNIQLFLKNKATVFFSFLAPILIFLLYTFFLGDFMTAPFLESLDYGVELDARTFDALTSAWMIAGVISMACFTIGLNSTLVMVEDKEKRMIGDFVASPLSPIMLHVSYFLSAFIVTFTLCFLVMTLGFLYLVIFTSLIIGFIDFLLLTGILFLGTLSAVALMLCVMSFFKSNAASAAFTGIFSALIGFLIGAYIPAGMLPRGVQNITGLIPGSHTSTLLRNTLIRRTYYTLYLPEDMLATLSNFFSFNLTLFGTTFTTRLMFVYIAISTILFGALFFVIAYLLRCKSVK